MKTLLFCTSAANASAENGEPYDGRIQRWVDHHAALPWPSPTQFAVFVDGDARPPTWPDACEDRISWDRWRAFQQLNLFPRLGRPDHLAYPGWWRSFVYAFRWAQIVQAERIVHVESDFMVTSERMVERIDRIRSGWVAFYCPRHEFAESAIQVIAKDRFPACDRIRVQVEGKDYRFFDGRHAESVLPFDEVVRDMVGDRYGEAGIDPATIEGLDYYGQMPNEMRAVYRSKEEVT